MDGNLSFPSVNLVFSRTFKLLTKSFGGYLVKMEFHGSKNSLPCCSSVTVFPISSLWVVIEIKRLNNMMSEHGIYSRERLLIPISDPELLHNSTCFIELDDHAKREVAVLYQEGSPNGISVLPTQRGSRKLIDSVKRSLQDIV
ncbi:hypothetical protein M5K25_008776 [Dendrobium thyrsiflorum]|uniref:Uncharacterized protein n=1 Tax=Dendrobium thyrsiflorum TaxID=117978 RepID=A0ABD0V8Z9_DENTH